MEDNFNFSQVKNEKSDEFKIDDDMAQVFFNEIIVAAALKDMEKFEKLISLNLPWLDRFSVEKKYELEKQNEGYSLENNTEYYPTFIHQAASVFPDEYCVALLEEVLLLRNNREKVNKDLREYIDLSRKILMSYRNPYYLVRSLLLKDSIQSFNYLQKMEVIDDLLICKVIFLNHYNELEKYGDFILKNNKKMVDFFLGSPNGKQVGAMHSALIETMNYSSTQNPTTILKFFEKIMTNCPEYHFQILKSFLPILVHRNTVQTEKETILIQLVLNNMLSIHSLYSKEKNEIVNERDNVSDAKSIKDILNLDQKFINKLILLQKEKLEKTLDNVNGEVFKPKL